jgi:hypothetical protein
LKWLSVLHSGEVVLSSKVKDDELKVVSSQLIDGWIVIIINTKALLIIN